MDRPVIGLCTAVLRRVIALAKSDADDDVRIAACHALGAFQDKSAEATLESIAQTDASGLVRDTALIALRRL